MERGRDKEPRKTSVRLTILRAWIYTQDLPNVKQGCQPLDPNDRRITNTTLNNFHRSASTHTHTHTILPLRKN